MYIIIVGGGKLGLNLTTALHEHGHEVLLLEKNRMKFEKLFRQIGDLVYCGDGSDANTLKAIGAERADVVVAATGLDENNLAISLEAKALGAKRVISRVSNPKNEEIFRVMEIDQVISTTKIIFNIIVQEVEMEFVLPFIDLQRGNLEAVRLEIGQRCPYCGKPLSELDLPKDMVVAGVIREDRFLLARSDLTIEAGDWLLVLTPSHKINEVGKYFRTNENFRTNEKEKA